MRRITGTGRRLEPGGHRRARVTEVASVDVELIISRQEMADMTELPTVGVNVGEHVWSWVGRARQFEGRDRLGCYII